MTQTYLIAEAGSCHDGNLIKALALVKAAKLAGADACKFQYWSSAKRLAARRVARDYLAVYGRYQVPLDWLPILHQACHQEDLDFLCTAYLPDDVARVAPHVAQFKVASFEALDQAFIDCHWPHQKPVLISCGMMDWTEVKLLYARVQGFNARLLHCVSAYPCGLENAALGALDSGYFAGYSDHTGSVVTGAVAVARGATVLEVHLRLAETDDDNPDCACALLPGQLAAYVSFVRQTERGLQCPEQKTSAYEDHMRRYRVEGNGNEDAGV